MMEQDAGERTPFGLRGFVEQLGASSSTWGVANAGDWLEKVFPGGMAKLKVARDDEFDGLDRVRPFVEQLGVASGKLGVRDVRDAGNALFGLMAKWSVAKYAGVDMRAEAYRLIEERVMPLPIEVKRKALLLSALYSVASRLPDLR